MDSAVVRKTNRSSVLHDIVNVGPHVKRDQDGKDQLYGEQDHTDVPVFVTLVYLVDVVLGLVVTDGNAAINRQPECHMGQDVHDPQGLVDKVPILECALLTEHEEMGNQYVSSWLGKSLTLYQGSPMSRRVEVRLPTFRRWLQR